MNWLYNFYFGEGPGIPKDAPKPEGVRLLASVLGREWWELLKLNLLFIACALPLVTLPAAYFAMTSLCVKMIEDRNVYLWRDFWSAFHARFWIVTALGMLACCAGALAVLAVKTYAVATLESLIFIGPLVVATTVLVLLPLYLTALFVALAHIKGGSLRMAAKAAAIGFLTRPLPGLAALFFVALLWLAHILFYPVSVLLPVLVNFSLGALVTAFAALGGIKFGFTHIAAVSEHGTTRRPKTQSA